MLGGQFENKHTLNCAYGNTASSCPLADAISKDSLPRVFPTVTCNLKQLANDQGYRIPFPKVILYIASCSLSQMMKRVVASSVCEICPVDLPDLGAYLGVLLGSVATYTPTYRTRSQYTWNPHFSEKTRSPPDPHYSSQHCKNFRHSVVAYLERRDMCQTLSVGVIGFNSLTG